MKHLHLTLIACLICSISFGGFFGGDVLTTKDGKVIEGKITKVKNCEVILITNEYKYVVPAAHLSSIQFEKPKGRAYRQYMALDSDSEFNLQMAADDDGSSMKEWPLILRIALGVGIGLNISYWIWYLGLI